MTLRDMISMYEGGAHSIIIISANEWTYSADAWASDILVDEAISDFLDANVVSWSVKEYECGCDVDIGIVIHIDANVAVKS